MKCTECNQPVKPVVAFDIDGTLADYHGYFLRFAAHWLGINQAAPDGMGALLTYDGSCSLAEWLDVDIQTYRQIKLAYRQGGMKRSMPAFPNASQVVNFFVESGIEVWITTTRPYLRLDNVDPDTRHWLERNCMMYSGLIYDENKYERLIEIVGHERICGVVEDLPEKFDIAWELGLRPVQHGTPYNSAVARTPRARNLVVAGSMILDQVREWRELHAHH